LELNCSHIIDPGSGTITLRGDYQGREFRIQIVDGEWHQMEGDLSREEAESIIDQVMERIFGRCQECL